MNLRETARLAAKKAKQVKLYLKHPGAYLDQYLRTKLEEHGLIDPKIAQHMAQLRMTACIAEDAPWPDESGASAARLAADSCYRHYPKPPKGRTDDDYNVAQWPPGQRKTRPVAPFFTVPGSAREVFESRICEPPEDPVEEQPETDSEEVTHSWLHQLRRCEDPEIEEVREALSRIDEERNENH